MAIAPPLGFTLSGSSPAHSARSARRLRRERLVELDDRYVIPGDSRPLQRLVGRLHGRDAEDVGVDAGRAACDDARQRRGAEGRRTVLVGHEQGAGAVVERGGVARGDGAVPDEGRLAVRPASRAMCRSGCSRRVRGRTLGLERPSRRRNHRPRLPWPADGCEARSDPGPRARSRTCPRASRRWPRGRSSTVRACRD